jgi:aminoglycoside phosphotransferase (APT) family kinase protein
MHENEYKIDENLVRTLLSKQAPQWARLSLKVINSSGTAHALYRLGSEYVVRLPRLEGATDKIHKECEWLPRLAPLLNVPISEPIFKGSPTEAYPSYWIVAKWNEGLNPSFEIKDEYNLLARDLALFLNRMHEIRLPHGPFSRRGLPLKEVDEEVRQAIGELDGEVDISAVTTLWNQLSNLPYWSQDPVWVHGDLLPGNILIQNSRLSGVIDFSDVGRGDPACDLIVAWSLLNSNSRRVFRDHLEYIDDLTWERGRGWALSIALIILPYYKYTNPALSSVARRMIENLTRQ